MRHTVRHGRLKGRFENQQGPDAWRVSGPGVPEGSKGQFIGEKRRDFALLLMYIGINYPWIDYGWDFGDPPPAWVADENLRTWRIRKREQIEEDFRRFSSQGIFAVRWFLLADGTNYGTGEFAPRNAGNTWTFDPLPPDHPYYRQFRDDFEFVLQACARHNLQFFPSLIDFRWCHQGTAIGGGTGIIKGGRYDIIRDPEKRRAFFDRALDPLLEAAVAYRDSIYAWELVNEPEWVVREFSLQRNKDGNCTVPLRAMKAFIAEGIRRINGKVLPDGRRAFHSSVGFAHWESLETWDSGKLGITLHQFHYYAQKDSGLPPYPGEENHPCVIGEFATAGEHDWPDLKGRQQDQTVANRLGCLEEKGYPACFLWSARAADAATRWTADEQEEVSAYTGFNRPKPVP